MKYDITELPNTEQLWGLKYRPTIEPTYSDEADLIAEFMATKNVPQEYSQHNLAALGGCVRSLGLSCRCILEIGVARVAGPRTSTSVLTKSKPAGCVYLGVDAEDRSFIAKPDSGVYTLRANSDNGELVRTVLRVLGHTRVGLLHIDGWHSIRAALSDWHEYAPLVVPGGIVVIHDTSVHPGPVALYEAIDEKLFDKRKLFEDAQDDWGMAILQRRN